MKSNQEITKKPAYEELEEENKRLTNMLIKNISKIPKSRRLKDKIEVIERAEELGLVRKEKYIGFDFLIDAHEEDVRDEWEELEDWVNEQRNIRIKLDISKIVKKEGDNKL